MKVLWGAVAVAGLFSIAYAGNLHVPAMPSAGIPVMVRDGRPVKDINAFVRKMYPGCRILDKDTDDGFLEVKIRHEGREKILLFDGRRWIRTLWELRRESLPKVVISALQKAGFEYRNIDDNDNMAVDTPDGRFYAVQAERGHREGIFVVSARGVIVHRYTSDSWNDGRLFEDNWAHERWDDGEDHFDEGDDEWDFFRIFC